MRTNKIVLIGLAVVTIAGITSCGGVKREQNRVYMPDMAYSRAVETYANTEYLKEAGINYNATPVAGTMKRGMTAGHFTIAMDKVGDSANYVASKQVVNPLPALNAKDMEEAKRLYNVNCGICHGNKLDGNGPLYKGGDGPYPAKPATLVGDAKYENMPAGQMMYSLTYGKNLMGSYAAQLSTKQRWMVIHYIKSMQPGGKAVAATVAADTTKAVK
jgi:mono/diheme cytochrome c family protein